MARVVPRTAVLRTLTTQASGRAVARTSVQGGRSAFSAKRIALWALPGTLAFLTLAKEAVAAGQEEKKEAAGTSADPAGWAAKNGQLDKMQIFSGRANPELATEIATMLGVPLGRVNIKAYPDGEIGLQVMDNVRGQDVYIIQPTCPPGVNDNIMELLLMISTMRRASANRITAVIPYYGYARQDRKMASRVPISAADVARLLQAMGADRVVAVDLHCGQIQGFFQPRCPCDNLEGSIVALPYLQTLGLKSDTTKVVSPDAGGVYRAKRFRESLKKYSNIDAGLAMIIKQRVKAGEVGKMDLVGSVDGCDCIIVDDMIDTAGTLTKAAGELKQFGAKRVFAFATHGIFSDPAYERINDSVLEKVIVCNSIPLNPDPAKPKEKIVSLSLAGLLASAIARIQSNQSVSALFQELPQKLAKGDQRI